MADTIRTLADRYWDLALSASPLSATLLGIHSWDDQVDDVSEAAESDLGSGFARLLDEVTAIDERSLTSGERTTRALLVHQLTVGVEATSLRLAELASDQMTGVHAMLLMVAPQLTYPEVDHAEAAVGRYSKIPVLLDQALDRFRAGLAAGRTPAAAVIARSINSVAGYLESPLDSDPFPAAALPQGWSGEERWRSRVTDVVDTQIRPAFERYLTALREELAPRGRPDDRAGWCWIPDGDELYAALMRSHTTLSRSPVELHELGVRHTEQLLPTEYLQVGGETFGESDLGAIFDRLRTDPALRHRDGAEILATAEDTVARATAAMGDWFGRLPTVPCQVSPVPDFLAADAPYAYYFPPAKDGSRPGTYFINTADPEEASRAEAESIAFHEAIPGHHLQLSIGQELEDLPDFQRYDGATSYIEGWGLYAERLADEMGLYSDGVARLGMLAADSWRSARLVVDTGLHTLGWSRQQALDYFEEHTPVPMDQVYPEVDRYLAMPAQALAYKVGQLEIQRLRSEAEDRLGDAFDIAGFHDVVLGSGAVTLPVLADIVQGWAEATASVLE